MYIIAEIALIAWIPIVLVIFGSLPPRRAALTSTIFAWLFLPNISFSLPGLPDFSKVTATTIGVVIGLVLFDRPGIARFRFRWYDIPVLVWCFGNFFTSVSNELGPYGGMYDGLSETLKGFLLWGFPYFIGRVCLDDLEGLKDCAVGVVIGGLIYVPLCFWEIRMSQTLHRYAYGVSANYEVTRFSFGYRPIAFLSSGLEVGMWMAAASLCAYWLWASGTVKELRGVALGLVVVILVVTTLCCKSVGSIMLMGFGILLLESVRRTKTVWLVVALSMLAPTYIATRTLGIWSGKEVIWLTQNLVSERTSSVSLRIDSEDHLMARAFQRPILGWGGYSRSRIIIDGKDQYPTDGLWILMFGKTGFVGLIAMTLTFVLPTILTCRRFPARLWGKPPVAVAGLFGTLLGLYMIDNLSNAMANPMYAIIVGGVMGLEKVDLRDWKGYAAGLLAMGDSLKEAGEVDAAHATYLESLDTYENQVEELSSNPEALAEFAYGHEAVASLLPADQAAEARRHLTLALKAREVAALLVPQDPTVIQRVAVSYENLGRLLASQDATRDAEWARSRAIQILQTLTEEFPDRSEYFRQLADGQNDLAWLLVTSRDSRPDALSDAIRLAKNSAELFPAEGMYWNTLGAAAFYSGDYHGAVDALTRSVELGGGTGFDLYYLAMAHAKRDANETAIASFAAAESWAHEHQAAHAELARLRAEAANVLGV